MQLLCDVSVLKLHEMMPHHRPVQFRRDQQLLHSDNLTLMTPFIYSPLHLSPAKNNSACTEHGCITFRSLSLSVRDTCLFISRISYSVTCTEHGRVTFRSLSPFVTLRVWSRAQSMVVYIDVIISAPCAAVSFSLSSSSSSRLRCRRCRRRRRRRRHHRHFHNNCRPLPLPLGKTAYRPALRRCQFWPNAQPQDN